MCTSIIIFPLLFWINLRPDQVHNLDDDDDDDEKGEEEEEEEEANSQFWLPIGYTAFWLKLRC